MILVHSSTPHNLASSAQAILCFRCSGFRKGFGRAMQDDIPMVSRVLHTVFVDPGAGDVKLIVFVKSTNVKCRSPWTVLFKRWIVLVSTFLGCPDRGRSLL